MHRGFADRLKRTRKAAGLTPIALARLAGLTSPTTAYTLERGENVPRVDTVERLAQALGIAPSALAFGIEQAWEPAATLRCEGLRLRLRHAREVLGLSLRVLAQHAETSVNCIHRAQSGETLPTLETVEKLAKALGVSPAWLAYGLGPMEAVMRGRAARHGQAEANAR